MVEMMSSETMEKQTGVQCSLFEGDEYQHSKWHREWTGMPEYTHKDMTPERSLVIHFKSNADFDEFIRLTGIKVTNKSKFAWFPQQNRIDAESFRYSSNEPRA